MAYERLQFPISLAFAITVHSKVQGMTLNNVIVKLDKNFFASGQAYTALSRAQRLEDLHLIKMGY